MTTARDGLRALAEGAIAVRNRNVVNGECGHDPKRFTAGVGCMACHSEQSAAERAYERATAPSAVLSLLAAFDQAEARVEELEGDAALTTELLSDQQSELATLAALTAERDRLRGALKAVKETHYAHECSACFKIATVVREALEEVK